MLRVKIQKRPTNQKIQNYFVCMSVTRQWIKHFQNIIKMWMQAFILVHENKNIQLVFNLKKNVYMFSWNDSSY